MNAKSVILLINHNQRNLELLSEFLGKEGYETVAASSMEKLDQFLIGNREIDVALVDITGFNEKIWEYCEQLRKKKIAFVVISPRQSSAIQQAGMTHGARGIMVKPLVIKELMVIIKNMVET